MSTVKLFPDITSWAKKLGADDHCLEVIPTSENEELVVRLRELGWVFKRWQTIGSCNPQNHQPIDTPRVEQVCGPTTEFLDAYLSGAREEQQTEPWRRFFKARYTGENWRLSLARDEGKPAGAASMMLIDGAAHFSNCHVNEEFRCRGLQTEMLQARLNLAREQGIGLATVDTQPDTQSLRNCVRAGFQLAMHVTQWVRPERYQSTD
ncbi:MAG: GNAT family N-acetyltransferase [Planctomycetota bacterium]|jgi:ribosomal protein S18 acetylase RimI-like enzyme